MMTFQKAPSILESDSQPSSKAKRKVSGARQSFSEFKNMYGTSHGKSSPTLPIVDMQKANEYEAETGGLEVIYS